MDTHDSPRFSVPARMPASRPTAALAPRFGSAQPESAPSPISLRVAFRGARRYWWLVLALWAVGSAGLGTGIWLKIRPTYRANSLLRVEPSTTDLYKMGTQGETLDAFLQTQVQLISSANVLTAAGTNPKATALARIQTAGDVVMELRKAIQVAILPGTYLIEVSMTSTSANEAAVLVNAVVGSFVDSNVEWSDGMTRGQIKNLENYLVDLKNQSDDLERKWRELVRHGEGAHMVTISPKAAATKPGAAAAAEPAGNPLTSLSYERYLQIQANLFDVSIELATAEASLEAAKRAADNAVKHPTATLDSARVAQAIERGLKADPELARLTLQLREAQSKLANVRRVSRSGGDPAEKAAQRKIADVSALVKEVRDEKTKQVRSDIETSGGALDPERETRETEAKVVALRTRQAALKAEFDKLKLTKKQEATDEVDIILIRDNRENLKAMQDTVARRLEQLKFESRGEARIRAVNDAVAPRQPISDKRMMYMAMTPVGILGLVLGLVVLMEIKSGRVGDPDFLSSRVRHEVFSIAPLPNIRPGDDANDERAEQRLARFVQSLDHLRVALCEGGVPGEGRCVMITSATGGEGKTTLSAHLAARCANAGTSTLLIDADMRRASLGRLLDVPVGHGLGDVLAGEVELDEALITVQAGGFHFLSAGLPGRDPSRVLKSARLAELVGRLRMTYDLVIIDTPPILPVADALIMGRWADGAVMAARFDASRLPLVERASRQLAAAGIPVLGVVVNGVRGQDANYGNYAYSYNYPGRAERAVEAPPA